MKEVVRATCPGCRRPLTIPADWTGQAVRCKHCRHVMEVRRKVPLAVPVGVPVGAPAPTWEPLPDDASLPEYTPPVAPAALAARVNKYVSAFDTRDKYTGRGRYSGPRRGWVKYLAVGFLFAALAGGSAAVAYLRPGLFSPGGNNPTGPSEPENPVGGGGGAGGGGGPSTAASGIFPRRMLAISVQNYLFANPLYNGETGDDIVLDRFRERWRVPKDQYYHLTDGRLVGDSVESKKEPGKKSPAGMVVAQKSPPRGVPLKSVIEGTISRFLDSSRAQDRIVLVFCGHAIEKKGEAYLLPLEGDLDEVESLIPLRWLYEKLGACKAQDKLIVFDVCRFHPGRGVQRPHFGPMTEALEKALHDSPAGVSVITSCSTGEQSLETDAYDAQFNFGAAQKGHAIDVVGSYFVSMLRAAAAAGALTPEKKLPAPTDEIPVERFATWMTEKLAEVVKNKFSERTQTVKATLKPRGDAVAFDPAEPQPGRFDFPAPPPSADPKTVQSIVREIQLPPIKPPGKDGPPPLVTDVLPFSQEALKDYLAGELKTDEQGDKFQKAIRDAVTEMRQLGDAEGGAGLRVDFPADTPDKDKEDLKKAQEIPARVEAILQNHLDDLEAVADFKEKQPKRWQVHYDYVVAQVKLRLCYANQYNLALANVRGGKVPDLNPGDTGYRLTAQTTLDKNTGGNYKDMYSEAKKALAEISKQHPNTPWALLAKSDRSVAIGLKLTSGTVAR